ncbi:hypothetical protein K8R43_05630, partial [archaeon]|nr:hypothetical protein [archaeon]
FCGICQNCTEPALGITSCINAFDDTDIFDQCSDSAAQCSSSCTNQPGLEGICFNGQCKPAAAEEGCVQGSQFCENGFGCVNREESDAANNCGDGIDNDCDLLIDCDDVPDCTLNCGGPDLGMLQVRVLGPTKESHRSKATAEVYNHGPGESNSYTVNFTVIDRKTGNPTGLSHVVTINTKHVQGVTKLTEWEFTAPGDFGEYDVKAKVIDTVSFDTNDEKINILLVAEDEQMTGDEYPFLPLLLIILAIPLIAYYLRKKKTRKRHIKE